MLLKPRWARFFTLASWNWKLALQHTGADFIVTFRCGHTECGGSHQLSVRICEKTLDGLWRKHADLYHIHQIFAEPRPALFGDGPQNTFWQMAHGGGGGDETVAKWIGNADGLWKRAAHD